MTAFAKRALLTVRKERPTARSVAITIHGPGYGLDELDSIDSLVNGLMLAATEHPDFFGGDSFSVAEGDQH